MKRRIEFHSDDGVTFSDRPNFLVGLRSAVRAFVCELRDPYRPELHYMRGPGPKARAAAERMASSH